MNLLMHGQKCITFFVIFLILLSEQSAQGMTTIREASKDYLNSAKDLARTASQSIAGRINLHRDSLSSKHSQETSNREVTISGPTNVVRKGQEETLKEMRKVAEKKGDTEAINQINSMLIETANKRANAQNTAREQQSKNQESIQIDESKQNKSNKKSNELDPKQIEQAIKDREGAVSNKRNFDYLLKSEKEGLDIAKKENITDPDILKHHAANIKKWEQKIQEADSRIKAADLIISNKDTKTISDKPATQASLQTDQSKQDKSNKKSNELDPKQIEQAIKDREGAVSNKRNFDYLLKSEKEALDIAKKEKITDPDILNHHAANIKKWEQKIQDADTRIKAADSIISNKDAKTISDKSTTQASIQIDESKQNKSNKKSNELDSKPIEQAIKEKSTRAS